MGGLLTNENCRLFTRRSPQAMDCCPNRFRSTCSPDKRRTDNVNIQESVGGRKPSRRRMDERANEDGLRSAGTGTSKLGRTSERVKGQEAVINPTVIRGYGPMGCDFPCLRLLLRYHPHRLGVTQ
jgi:hypothetical protein